MRVALVCPYSWSRPGGVQAHVAGLARSLRAHDLEVDIIAPSDGEMAADSFFPVGRSVPIPDNGSLVPVALSPLAPFRTARLLASRGYDLVHVHEPMIPAVSLTAILTSKTPLVGTFHMHATRPRWYRPFAPLCHFALARLDVRVAVSEAARRHVARTCPGDYRIIPNGIDYSALASLRAPRTGSRLLFVGRAERRKGLPVLLEAFKRLPEATELDLVGVSARELKRAGVALSPASRARVRPHGVVPDEERNRLLARADVLCVPSLEGESFGVVVAEGMAAGVPVVASALPGYTEVLPESAGRLVPPGDPERLAAAVGRLLADDELRARLGRAGRRAAARVDWPRIAEEILAVYGEALRRRGSLVRLPPRAPAAADKRGPARLPASGQATHHST